MGPATPGSIALTYKVPNGTPVLGGYSIVPQSDYLYAPKVVNGYLGYTMFGRDVRQWDLGTMAPPKALGLQLSAEYSNYPGNTGIAGDGRRLYLVYGQAGGSDPWQLTIYDLTVSQPTVLRTLTIPAAGSPGLRIVGNLLLCGTDVYTVDGDNPTLAAHLPSGTIVDADSVRMRVLDSVRTGVRVIDLADPFHPRFSAPTPFLRFEPPPVALGPGDTFFAANGELEAYSVVWARGGSPGSGTAISAMGLGLQRARSACIMAGRWWWCVRGWRAARLECARRRRAWGRARLSSQWSGRRAGSSCDAAGTAVARHRGRASSGTATKRVA